MNLATSKIYVINAITPACFISQLLKLGATPIAASDDLGRKLKILTGKEDEPRNLQVTKPMKIARTKVM